MYKAHTSSAAALSSTINDARVPACLSYKVHMYVQPCRSAVVVSKNMARSGGARYPEPLKSPQPCPYRRCCSGTAARLALQGSHAGNPAKTRIARPKVQFSIVRTRDKGSYQSALDRNESQNRPNKSRSSAGLGCCAASLSKWHVAASILAQRAAPGGQKRSAAEVWFRSVP